MTGKQMIKWIKEHNAEDAELKIMHDSSGPGIPFTSYDDGKLKLIKEKFRKADGTKVKNKYIIVKYDC